MGDPTVLSFCPACGGSIDVENDYIFKADTAEFFHIECAPLRFEITLTEPEDRVEFSSIVWQRGAN